MNNNFGLTLIEILIAIGILTIILSFGYLIGFDFYKNYALQSEKDLLVSILRKARSQALNNVGAKPHGVYIDNSSYTIFYGNSYVSRDSQYDENIKKAPGINLSGLNEIVFAPLTATSTASGTIVLNNGTGSFSIDVNYEGRINWR
jgi:prepilin-type N-terminal cleavage/methylation domain-containing protein